MSNFDALSMVKFGNEESLKAFLFENGVQHKTFAETLADLGITVQRFPLMDANPNDLDDWLAMHEVEHLSLSTALNVNNPINLMDVDFNNEASFYDWLATHLSLHQQISDTLGL